jgi:hypothetical protein
MNTDKKAKNDRASAGDASGGKDQEIEEIIDLVDEVLPDDDSSQLEQAPEVEFGTEVDDEDLIELTDVVEEDLSETKIGDATLEGEEEEIIELVDEVVPEVDSGQEQEESVELDEMAEGPGSGAEKTGSPELSETEIRELSEAQISISESDEDSEIDTLGIENAEGGPETPVDEVPEDEDLDIPEEAEQPLVDSVETQPEAEDWSELGLDKGASEPVDRALGQAVLEKLSDEKLEEIITRTVKQTIDQKVERILLEAAESAIAKEMERLKPAV